MKRPIIAGNWKMNNTNATTKKLLAEIAPLVADWSDILQNFLQFGLV